MIALLIVAVVLFCLTAVGAAVFWMVVSEGDAGSSIGGSLMMVTGGASVVSGLLGGALLTIWLLYG